MQPIKTAILQFRTISFVKGKAGFNRRCFSVTQLAWRTLNPGNAHQTKQRPRLQRRHSRVLQIW